MQSISHLPTSTFHYIRVYLINKILFVCVCVICFMLKSVCINDPPITIRDHYMHTNSPLKTSYRITHTPSSKRDRVWHKVSKQIERLESNRCKETLHSLREMQSLEMMINFCIVSICVSVHWELLFDKMSYDKRNEMRRNRTKNAKVSNKT